MPIIARIYISNLFSVDTEELAWPFMHRNSCSQNGECSICETRSTQSGNSSSDNQHVGRLSYTTEQGAQFEDSKKGEKGVLRNVRTLMRSLKLSLP